MLRFSIELERDPDLAPFAHLVLPQLRLLGAPQLVVDACDRLTAAWMRAKGETP